MRAKMTVRSVETFETNENLVLNAVAKNEAYPDDGADENNSYAKFTPSAELRITIANPALTGQFKVGDTFYVDFHRLPEGA